MKIASLKKAFIALSILAAVGHAGMALAHSGGGTIDPAGNNAMQPILRQLLVLRGTDPPFWSD